MSEDSFDDISIHKRLDKHDKRVSELEGELKDMRTASYDKNKLFGRKTIEQILLIHNEKIKRLEEKINDVI